MTKSSNTVTIGVGGHGMLIAPVCPCRIRHREGGTLFLTTTLPGRTETFAAITPGSRPAVAAPRRLPLSDQQIRFACDDNGPVIALGPGVPNLSDVIVRVDTGFPNAPWILLGPGFGIELPPSFMAQSSAPGDEDRFFQVSTVNAPENTLISFSPIAASPADVPLNRLGLEDWERKLDGVLDASSGPIRWIEFGYRHDGATRRQRKYLLPHAAETLVMIAQARDDYSSGFFEDADRIASSYQQL